jgi:hypothetical protein
MKGENYLYFCDTTDEPNAADEAILVPASTLRGITCGANTGLAHPARITMHFEGFVGDGNSKADVTVLFGGDPTGVQQIQIVDDIANAINSNPGDGFVTIVDSQNGVFCNPLITGCTVDSAS